MAEPDAPVDRSLTIQELATLLTLAGAWSTLPAICYLLALYSSFGINIFDYLGPQDIFMRAVPPIATVIVGVGLGIVAGHYFPIIHFPAGGASPSQVRTFKQVLVLVYCLFILAAVVSESPYRWMSVYALAAGYASFLVGSTPLAQRIFPSKPVRDSILLLMILAPYFSYTNGAAEAREIQRGLSFQFSPFSSAVVLAASNVTEPASPLRQPRFIGRAGDYLFFYDPSSDATIIRKFEGSLTLKQFRN